jgi:hypothetical protein
LTEGIALLRFFAGVAACLLLITGAFLIWQSHARQEPGLPAAPGLRAYSASMLGAPAPLQAPQASSESREEKRFSRYDKNKDGKVQADEYLAARRRNFDKLDADHNGALSFQEYAVKGVEKFNAAGGRKGWLSAAEFVATAPPPAKRKTCSCGRVEPAATVADSNDD